MVSGVSLLPKLMETLPVNAALLHKPHNTNKTDDTPRTLVQNGVIKFERNTSPEMPPSA